MAHKALPPSRDNLRQALAAAGFLARDAERVARAARSDALIEAREHRQKAEAADEHAADMRLRARLLGYVPGLGFARRRAEGAVAQARRDRTGAREAARGCEARARRLKALADRIATGRDKAGRAAACLHVLVDPDAALSARIRTCAGMITHTRRARPDGADIECLWGEEAANVVADLLRAVSDLAKATEVANRERASRRGRQAEGQSVPRRSRLYLPIPRTMGAMAEKAGALRDADAPKGASPWFVPHGTPLAPFGKMLPLVARDVPARLSFPPVPMRAAGQNLWSLFDADTWGHVRRQAYDASGRRCTVCGGRSDGFLAEKLYGEEERKHPIECHEVWDWRVPRESDGVGIQTLTNLLVVCRNCHPIFHSQFFVRRAQGLGIGDEVAEAIEKRRMLVNRETRAQVAAGVERASGIMRRASGVDAWVLDLSHLAAQGYMASHTPVMLEGNAAAMPPERVAGLAFDTDAGRSFERRPVAEVLGQVLRGTSHEAGGEVVAFRQR